MREILLPFLSWYLVTQIVTVAALPLTSRFFCNLPDKGYVFARILGILLVGLLLWLGTSYGLLRNSAGGAWFAVALVACLSVWATIKGREEKGEEGEGGEEEGEGGPVSARLFSTLRLPPISYVLITEALFLVAFATWTWVRANDPAINHTEQPMDLMFLSGIWNSPEYPPRDPWLSGYAISYYYFGYWMLTTLGRLAGQPPEITYNLGQACWFGLLITGSFGIGYNLMRLRAVELVGAEGDGAGDAGALPSVAGFATAAAVALTGNLHVILEWLYAQGVRLDGINRLVDVHNFPELATVSGLWYIDSGWSWWWRASRVVEDIDLAGNHIEIIDEFPIFSYVLADNHPHVLAMPFVVLVIAIALNLLSRDSQVAQDEGGEESSNPFSMALHHLKSLPTAAPLGAVGPLLLIAAVGALVFLNTWDFPPYLMLLLLALLFGSAWSRADGRPLLGRAVAQMGVWAAFLVVGALLLYLPYFLSAQSQAGGVLPNLLHPTRLPQFLLMFGHFLLAVLWLVIVAWKEQKPSAEALVTAVVLVVGLPTVFLLVTGYLTMNGGAVTAVGAETVNNLNNLGEIIIQRRLAHSWTFLIMAGLSSVVVALLWQRLVEPRRASRTTTFVLLLVGVASLLAYAPEFVYLRDNFGNRMNTVFKFYYQSWLLLAVAAAYAIALRLGDALRRLRSEGLTFTPARLLGYIPPALSLLLILACLIYPVAGTYAKFSGFGTRQPTLNGLAYVGADEQAVIDWIRRNTASDAVILEAKGASYNANSARISAATGRPTLLGWDGHEAQWRGPAYADMAAGRAEAIQEVYQRPLASTLPGLLNRWQIDYVLVGPEERAQYGITPALESRLGQILEVVLVQGSFRVYRASGGAEK